MSKPPIGFIGLGVMGGLGLAVLTFLFHLQPTAPPIDVMLMITAALSGGRRGWNGGYSPCGRKAVLKSPQSRRSASSGA